MSRNNEQNNVKLPFFGYPTVWPYVRQYKPILLGMICLGLIVCLCDAVFPLFQQYAINHFIAENTLDTLPWFIGLYAFLVLLKSTCDYFSCMNCGRMEMYTNRELRNNAFAHLQELSLSYYNTNNVGYIHARVMSDSGRIGEMFSWLLLECVWTGSYLIFSMIVMLIVDWRLALCVIVLVPVIGVVGYFLQKKLLVLNREVREQNSKITSNINEGITGSKSIKTLVVEDKMNREFEEDTAKMYSKSLRTARYNAFFMSSITFVASVAVALVLWQGGEMTVKDMIKIGTMSTFMSYALNMIWPIQQILSNIGRLIGIQVNVERYCKLINTQGEVHDTPEVIEKYGDTFNPKKENWEPLFGDIEFEDVTFHYPDGDEMVLEHFNLKVPQGTNVAIVGETGAGKSTLVNLVCRFFEPTEGRILIDGRDAKERSLQWLHSNQGYVLQSPHLFSGTIRENLMYGKPDATEEQILNALHLVQADEILKKLKNGLDTEIGEGGDYLSTGEKQLLCIARAMLADPRILILDEATASIDTVTEQAVQQAINTVIKGRTSFVIAHRLSTVVNADVILVIHDGKIVERGNHKELMKARGEFFKLYTRQYEELE